MREESLESMQSDREFFELLIIGCAVEEYLDEEVAKEQILEMIQRTSGRWSGFF